VQVLNEEESVPAGVFGFGGVDLNSDLVKFRHLPVDPFDVAGHRQVGAGVVKGHSPPAKPVKDGVQLTRNPVSAIVQVGKPTVDLAGGFDVSGDHFGSLLCHDSIVNSFTQ